MKMTRSACFICLMFLPSMVAAAGFVHNENFMVLAADEQLAEEVLARADQFRREVALQWLGKPLPANVGPAIINVVLSDTEDRGLTWPIDNPKRKYHKVWLTTSRERATGSTLRHEICHVVLATRFPQRLPEWAEEGAASLSDDEARIKSRRSTIDWYADTGNWPALIDVLERETITADDQASYSVAASVTGYLLSRGDKATFLVFAAEGKQTGWDEALRTHYGLGSVGELQVAWQTWASGASRITAELSSIDSGRPPTRGKPQRLTAVSITGNRLPIPPTNRSSNGAPRAYAGSRTD